MRARWQHSTRKPLLPPGKEGVDKRAGTKSAPWTRKQSPNFSKTSTTAPSVENAAPTSTSATPTTTEKPAGAANAENSPRCGKRCSRMRTWARSPRIPRNSLSCVRSKTERTKKIGTSWPTQSKTPSDWNYPRKPPHPKNTRTPSLNPHNPLPPSSQPQPTNPPAPHTPPTASPPPPNPPP